VSEIDLTTISEQEKAGALDLLYERAGLAGMDYQNGSALKVTLVRINDVRQVMVVSAESLWSDQRGLKNVVRDVIWEYEGKAREVDQVVQYADAAEIFNELIESEETAGGREYWGSRLGWRPIETRLFAEREGNGEFKPRVERRKVCGELSKRMKGVCESIGAGEEAAMLSLFGALIRRIGGDREIRIGVGYDGRTFDGLREAVGLYMRYLPIDISIDDDVAFSDLVKPVDASAREFYKWQNYFDWRQFLTTPGGGNGEGYFPYLFEYDAEESKYSSDSISYSIEGRYAFIDRFKLKLVCYKSGEGLTAELHYDSALYDQADMSGLADHYLTLLQSAVQSPRRAVGRLEMLNERQKELILNGFNQTRREYDAGGCVHEMIRDRAERSPEAIAVVFERQAISYGELNARANRLANYLRNRGVGPEQVVGVMLSRGIEMVVGLLGVMKAGAAYLPLDVDYPKRQIAYMLQDAGAALLLTERQYNDYLLGHNAPIVYIDREWELISQESEAAPTTQVDPQNLIYVMYTSGSTGKPKGAMLTHAGVVNCLCWMQETYMLDATDRFLMRTSLNFDPSVWELFWPLWVGAAVVIAEPQRHADASYLTRLIAEREITSAYFVPSMLSVFLNEPGLEARSSLRRSRLKR
jgi:non-ribosomal peptide synthetase component F